jgi:hypothetical protein
VWYRYEVNGKKYVHDVIKAGDAPGPRIFQMSTIQLTGNEATRIEHWEKQLAEKYRRDHAVTVYYNPASPAEACLERGNYPLLIFTLAASVLLICSGAHRVAQAPVEDRVT